MKMQNCATKTTKYVYFNPRHRNLNLMPGILFLPEAISVSGFLFLLIIFLSNILHMKTQAIGISHTGPDFCCVYRV